MEKLIETLEAANDAYRLANDFFAADLFRDAAAALRKVCEDDRDGSDQGAGRSSHD